MTKRTRGRMLIIRGGAIGDFILTLPAIQAIRRQFPEIHLEILGYPHIARLALIGERADGLRSIESRALARFFARGSEQDPEWIRYFESFDLALSYLYDPDSLFKDNVEKHVRGQFLEGRHRPDEALDVHATRVFLEPLEKLAIFDADPVPRLELPRSVPVGAPILAMHPGSGGVRKNWPRDKWMELARLLSQKTVWRFLIVGGEAEGEFLSELAACLPPERVEMVQRAPLDDLAGRLSRCAAFLGHDSGITHLAAATGIPVLALWGPSNESIWRPIGNRVQVLKADTGLHSLDPSMVHAGLVALLNPVAKREME